MRRTRPALDATRVVVLSVALFLVSWLFVGVPIFVFPPADKPEKVDVILVLGPPKAKRIALAESLVVRGYADHVIVSVPERGPYSAESLDYCTAHHSYSVECFTPEPFTTQGEARFLRDISNERGWTSAMVITFAPHIARAGMIITRCFPGTMLVIPSPERITVDQWLYQYAYQSAAFVKAAANPQC